MPQRSTSLAVLLALAATTAAPFTASAADGWYGGVQFGNSSLSEDFAPYGPPPVGAPVSYSVCGGTATLTPVGHPQVDSIEASATGYQFFVGRRVGAWGFEFGSFNVARFEERATADATPTQPPCPASYDIYIDGYQAGLVSYAFDGFAFTPVYSIPFGEGERWMVDLRATIAFWDGEERAQHQMIGQEFDSGYIGVNPPDPLQEYVVATNEDERHTHGVDLGVGLGVSYQLKEKVRVRGLYEQQAFGDFVVQSWQIGVAIDFP